MDAATIATLIVVGIFALVIVFAFLIFRKQGHAEIKGPFGTGLRVGGSNSRSNRRGGITAKGIRSRQGGMRADERTGSGIDVENINAKDDVILSSSNNQRAFPSNSSETNPNGDLAAQALSAGGNITIQQFVGNQATVDEQLAFFMQQIGITNSRQDYAKSQFEAYCKAWKSLQGLRLAGYDLWECADEDNILNFADQLRAATQTAYEGEIFFEEEDLSNLLKVLDTFSRFRLGKVRLIRIRSSGDLKEASELFFRDEFELIEAIDKQISRNYDCKLEYEKILEAIRKSFREKLSS